MEFKIEKSNSYTPQIGHLVSMMNYARYTTLQAVEGLSTKELDFLPSEDGNSISALLLHIAAVEVGFQIEIFENRRPNKEEAVEWGAAYELGEQGRQEIKGNSLEFYIEKLDEVRNRTLKEFQKLDDEWLYEERLWDNHNSNHYFIWFHVFEDEINHRGQMRIIRKML
ncbi:DinB family protein [Halobacillus ihumii]|uniref:DinB family protein n=1 Tax=Halobacillus ihumii TaxID=2686092 RepID=UPI0013D7999F|nr:DinB family protein [Halobacillus ihumii]